MKIVAALMGLVLLTGAVSCKQEQQKQLSANEIKAKVDSTVATRIDELNTAAMEDLDRRRSIEVKAKADSIVAAYIQAQTAPQTPVALPTGEQ